jgi:hypothetical protein
MTSGAKARQGVTKQITKLITDTINQLHVPQMVYGVVSAVSTSTPTCSVTLQGTSTVITGVRFTQSYAPLVGDTVYCARVGTDLFILGKVATAATWTPYTPALGATSTNPTLGNSTLLGRYQMLGPKTCAVRLQFLTGSTFSAGSGYYAWGLPFVPQSGGQQVGPALYNTGSTQTIALAATNNGVASFDAYISPSTLLSQAQFPGSGYSLVVNMVYETA